MITYFYRHKAIGFSIQRVFKTLTNQVSKTQDIQVYYMPSKRSMPWNIIVNSWFTFRYRNKTGINHITGHIHEVVLGLLGCKTILTIHDLVFLDNVKNPIKRFYKWFFWLYLPIRMSKKVVCISTKTKQNILQYIKTDKLTVIYNPVDPIFEYSPKLFNKEKPIILHIGTGWNKNLKRVVESLIDISCHLRIVGKLSLEQQDFLKQCHIDYSNVYKLTDDEIKLEYINCDIVSFPSEYEGFGMPIIEGQKTGRIVVASKIEPLIEVSGDAVVYVDPLDVVSIKKAFLKAIDEEAFRTKIIALGNENVKRFDVKKIASDYIGIYKIVMTKN